MEFRRTYDGDTDAVMRIVEGAKERLRRQGIDQWQRGYPSRESIGRDAEAGVGAALCDGGRIAVYGAVIFTGEPAYDDISGGRWLTDGPYAVIHRLCTAEDYLGRGCASEFLRRAEEFVGGRAASIRIDTHPDNTVMQRLIARSGFVFCGEVTIESRRLAYEKVLG